MEKVSIDNTYIKEEIIVDPYIPLQVKFGNLYSWEDNRHYIRFGDMKTSMLEVGFLSDSGIIRSINLIGAREIYINKGHDFEIHNCEEGIIIFNQADYFEKYSRDVISNLVISTSKNEILLSFSNDEVVKFVQNGVVRFGLNKLEELCCFVVSGFSVDKMKKLNNCLEYMLNC